MGPASAWIDAVRKAELWQVVVSLGLISASLGQNDGFMFELYPYHPALISTTGPSLGHTNLLVFPLHGKAYKTPIHSLAGPFAYSPNGKAIYGQCTPPAGSTETDLIALCRLDLETASTSPIRGSSGLYALDIAVSSGEDHVLVSGVRRQKTDVRGLFDLTPATGAVRLIMTQEEAHPKFAWRHLSLPPLGRSALAARNGHVEIIDLLKGTFDVLPGGFFMAAWSPDGRSLVALENGENGRTILMDANLVQRRVLEHTELGWSPDSRYLLGLRRSDRCGPDYATLELIEVDTGKKTIVQSSECQINQSTTGWVLAESQKGPRGRP